MTPVTRGEVEAAVVRLRIADVGNGQSIIDGRVAVRALFDRLFVERDEAQDVARALLSDDLDAYASAVSKAHAVLSKMGVTP